MACFSKCLFFFLFFSGLFSCSFSFFLFFFSLALGVFRFSPFAPLFLLTSSRLPAYLSRKTVLSKTGCVCAVHLIFGKSRFVAAVCFDLYFCPRTWQQDNKNSILIVLFLAMFSDSHIFSGLFSPTRNDHISTYVDPELQQQIVGAASPGVGSAVSPCVPYKMLRFFRCMKSS